MYVEFECDLDGGGRLCVRRALGAPHGLSARVQVVRPVGLCSIYAAKCPYYVVLYNIMQSVLIVRCFLYIQSVLIM